MATLNPCPKCGSRTHRRYVEATTITRDVWDERDLGDYADLLAVVSDYEVDDEFTSDPRWECVALTPAAGPYAVCGHQWPVTDEEGERLHFC